MVQFERQTIIPLPPQEAFDLALDIDAHTGSMDRFGERATGGVTTGIIGHGQYVTWKARHFGVTWKMTSQITEWEPPVRFVDEQHAGPFRSFWHEHRFVPVEGGTRVDDLVRFTAPLGPLGRVAEALVLRWYVPRLIDVRNEFLRVKAGRR